MRSPSRYQLYEPANLAIERLTNHSVSSSEAPAHSRNRSTCATKALQSRLRRLAYPPCDACERRAISRILNRDVLSPVPPLLAASHIKRSEALRRHQHASRISSQENSRASKTAPLDWPPCNL